MINCNRQNNSVITFIINIFYDTSIYTMLCSICIYYCNSISYTKSSIFRICIGIGGVKSIDRSLIIFTNKFSPKIPYSIALCLLILFNPVFLVCIITKRTNNISSKSFEILIFSFLASEPSSFASSASK